jgi:NADPH:quinone reductase-like Zn-dependent oxidoreductase
VRRFKPGDQVFGFTGFGVGAYAEYKCMPETGSLALKPANTTYPQAAAAVDGASTALFFLRDKAKLGSGQKVLVIGASGSIGTYAVQLAKHFGAEVTGVCSGRNADLVTSVEADQVIDYTTQDFTTTDATYDVIFDTVGRSSFAQCKDSFLPGPCRQTGGTARTPCSPGCWTGRHYTACSQRSGARPGRARGLPAHPDCESPGSGDTGSP